MYGYTFITAKACSLRARMSAFVVGRHRREPFEETLLGATGRFGLRRDAVDVRRAPARPQAIERHPHATRPRVCRPRRRGAPRSRRRRRRARGRRSPARLTPTVPCSTSSSPTTSTYGTFSQLGPADARPERVGVGVDQLDAPAVGPEAIDELARVVVVTVGDREDRRLHRRQPRGERAGVVLGEDGEEPLDGAEQRPVDHHRPVALVVGADVLELEALRELEVELDGRHLPRAADGVLAPAPRSWGRRTRRRLRPSPARGRRPRRRCGARWSPRPTPRRCRPPCPRAWSTARGRSRRGRSRAAR